MLAIPATKPRQETCNYCQHSSLAPVEYGGIVRIENLMRARIFGMYLLAALVAVPAYADRRSEAKSQVEFGISVAQKGLWKEATFRWEKAAELDPTYAAAWNNLGIAYEQQGKFDDARKAYDKAIKLDPENQMIRQNYDLFREIYDRTQRRRDR
jgi:Flp pilus assembly protein TadD